MSMIKDLLYSSARFLRQPNNVATILVYHSISHSHNFNAVTPESFEQQMRALAEHKFNVVSLDTLATYRTEGNIPPKTIAITFDDGYRDNFTTVFPILKKYSFPATIFIITDAIGTARTVRGETFEMLSESDLKELTASGLITLAPHTASHPKLDVLSPDDVRREFSNSKARIEEITKEFARHFAYPFGRSSTAVRTIARDIGFEYAYTVMPGFARAQSDAFAIPRNAVDYTTTLTQFLGIATWGRITRSRFL